MSNHDLRGKIAQLEAELAEAKNDHMNTCADYYQLYLAGLDISNEEFYPPSSNPADEVREYVRELKRAAKVLL